MKAAILAGQRALTHYALDESEAIYGRVGRNTGNMAFVTSIVDQLDVEWSFRGWNARAADFADVDVVVMPCANQFGAHTDMGHMGDLLLEVDKPVVAIGLGAQAAAGSEDATPTKGTVHWVDAMQRLRAGDAPNILVRGEYSRAQLARYGITSTEVVGCPSLFISKRADLGAEIASRRVDREPSRVATLAGNSSWGHLATVDQLMVSLAGASVQGLPWILQEELALIDLARGREISAADLDRLVGHFAPGMTPETFARWVQSSAAVFFDIEAWMEHMQRFEVCVGPRFHGAMLAMQAGTPAVVVTHDSRTEELCMTTGIPSVSARDLVTDGVQPLWEAIGDFDGSAFDKTRMALADTYRSALEQNGIPFLRWSPIRLAEAD